MFEKFGALWRVFKAGEAVANPVAWKRGQITVNALAAFLAALVALLRAFGVQLPITDEQVVAIATVALFLFGLFNHGATVASTDKVDALGRTPAANDAGHQPGEPLAREVERATGSRSPAGATDRDGLAPALQPGAAADIRPGGGPAGQDDFERQRAADSQRG